MTGYDTTETVGLVVAWIGCLAMMLLCASREQPSGTIAWGVFALTILEVLT